jgi:integrase
MTHLRLQYVHEFRDRHGKLRRYFRRPGHKRIALPGAPGSEEFMTAYQAALGGNAIVRDEIGAQRSKPGTIAAAVAGYFTSEAFRSLAPSTQRARRNILEHFRAEHGEKRIATLPTEAIERIVRKKKGEAARSWFKAFRGLLQFAVAEGFRRDDPTEPIKVKKIKTDGYRPWDEDLIARYQAKHALGTRARLALELLISTGQRRGDVVRMGRQHVRDGILSIRQEKTGTLVEIPVLPDLVAALDAMPKAAHLTFLTMDNGRAFKPNYFSKWFLDYCHAAGIPNGYTAHGLRKAAATRHAHSGATAHELMAWFGWSTLAEAERYTKTADRKRLAQGMVAKLETRTASGKPAS